MFIYGDKEDFFNKDKEFLELHGSIESFTSTNIDSIYANTESLDYRKYVILLKQIIKKRLETKKVTRVNFVTKEIVVKRKNLEDYQIRGLMWLANHEEYLIWRTQDLVNRFEKGKKIYGIKKQIDKHNDKLKRMEERKKKKDNSNDKYREILKYFDED